MMNKYICLLLIIIISTNCSSFFHFVKNDCVIDSLTSECVYVNVERMPIYCDGKREFINDIFTKISFDTIRINELITIVNVEFVINKEGKLIGARVVDKVELNNVETEILKAINSNKCSWSPGELNGEKVSVILAYPININLK